MRTAILTLAVALVVTLFTLPCVADIGGDEYPEPVWLSDGSVPGSEAALHEFVLYVSKSGKFIATPMRNVGNMAFMEIYHNQPPDNPLAFRVLIQMTPQGDITVAIAKFWVQDGEQWFQIIWWNEGVPKPENGIPGPEKIETT